VEQGPLIVEVDMVEEEELILQQVGSGYQLLK
jgi:hypothetical protein